MKFLPKWLNLGYCGAFGWKFLWGAQRDLGGKQVCWTVRSAITRGSAMNALRRYLLFLFRFSPRARTAMVVGLDVGLCTFAVLLAYSLRIGEWRVLSPTALQLVMLSCACWLAIAPTQGVYRSLLRFSGGQSIRDLATSCGIMAAVLTVFLAVLRFPLWSPRTLAVLVPVVLFLFLATSRLVLSALLRDTLYSRRRTGRRHVLIYGAGVAGRELALSIKEDPEFEVVGFVDDNPVLRGRRLEGYRIWHAGEIEEVLGNQQVNEVLLALPTAPRARRRAIVEEVGDLAPGVRVRSLPNLAEIAAGKVSVSDLREIDIEELLGRDQVAPDPRLMAAKIKGRRVMVTGAGGSIGSELTRQIVMQRPSQIVLAERSELALYLIEGELRELCERHGLEIEILSKLVDVADRADMERIYAECAPQTVFHAAAYKHVPLVEADPIAGIRNNILGTYNCCVLGEQYGVENFTLVSTDKAVRPSSVMGASKRVCELVVQARAAAQRSTIYSAVRFGNVLGSSGSVVPLFRRQIAAGGPVTITHRDATRYFMTIPEAAQLVVQAGAMAKGGEIFLLDMGEPVKIQDLAEMMIQLSGLAAIDGDGDGDIEIVEVGLRPGEKLHEELLIDNRGFPTSHPRIMKASEPGLAPARFDARFARLEHFMEARDAAAALTVIEEMIAGERSETSVVAAPRSRKLAKATTMTPPARLGSRAIANKRAVET
jgi:FlaA1/EpsC-like NDP-sugar epimerase